MSSETNAPLITSQRTIKTTLGAIGTLLALVSAGLLAWSSVKADVEGHGRQLDQHERRLKTVEERISSDHDILIEIRADLKALRRERTE